MSVQTGIWSFDSREITRREVEFLLFGLEDRGPDYADIQLCGPLAMGFRGFLITPEDEEDQPMRSSSGSVITFDGRLDRRHEVARSVGLPASTDVSDVALVLLAYERFGADCFEQLIGEYAFVIWDERRRSLFLVRSLCGTRPLFYILSDNEVLWSSELDDVVLKSNVEVRINDDYAIRCLFFHPDIDQSPFKNVTVVPSGSYVEINHAGQAGPPIPTWHPERLSTLQLASQEEYEEAWRNQVETAITDRMRVRGPLFSELSGGLDSSTIVVLADRILRRTGRDPALLNTISCTYETSEDSDESFFISLVERARGRNGIHVPESALGITLGLDAITFTGAPDTTHNFPGMYKSIAQAMGNSGCRVLFNGVGGDELFWSDATGSPELADLLVQRRVWTVLAKARAWSQTAGLPLWQVLLSSAIAPLTNKDHHVCSSLQSGSMGSLVADKAKSNLIQSGYRLGLRIDSQIELPSRRARAFSVRSFRAVFSTGTFRCTRGIHISHPFAHQSLIDFMLSLPMDRITRPGENRALMRSATRGILPERIRTRLSKAGPDEALCRALVREQHDIGTAAQLLVCQRGYASTEAVSKAIRESTLGRAENAGALLQIFSLERWLRSLALVGACRSYLRSSVTQGRATVGVAHRETSDS